MSTSSEAIQQATSGAPMAVQDLLSDAAWDAILASFAESTRRTYRAQWSAWCTWAARERVESLPAAPESVANYLAARVENGMAVSSAWVATAAIRSAHVAAGHPNPCAADVVIRTLAGLARTYGRPQEQVAPLDDDALDAIERTALTPRGGKTRALESVEQAAARGLLDVALARLLSDGGLRRSEASALTWHDVSAPGPNGSGILHIRRSKTDSGAEGAFVALTPAAMRALAAIRPDPATPDQLVFGLSSSQIGRRIAATAKAAGLEGHYSGHSGRVGLAIRMVRAGAPSAVVQRQGRWKSANMVALYTRRLDAAEALRYLP